MIACTHYSNDSRVRREAEALIARGDSVDVIALREPDTERRHILNGVCVHQISGARYRGSSASRYIVKYASFFVKASQVLTVLHLRNRFDIVQVHTMPDFMVFSALPAKIFGARIIIDVHDLVPELYRTKFNVHENHRNVRSLKWIERRSIAFAHRAIAVHEPHRELLVKHGSPDEKFSVLLNLPDPSVFERLRAQEREPDGVFRLLYHGTISRRHDLETAISAVEMLKEEIPNLKLCILGDGDDRDRLVRLVQKKRLEQYVEFSQGVVPLEELAKWLRRADLGIVPLVHDAFTEYMLPVKLLEYIWMGVPPIVTRTKTIEYYCKPSFVSYFDSGNVEQLADRVLSLYKSPQARRDLVRNAEEFREKTTWESEKLKYYELIDSLL